MPIQAVEVTTLLVPVSVVVQDKHGKPISGLKKSDFTVLDNKQPQEILFFSEEVNAHSTEANREAPLPPNSFTNKVASTGGRISNITVILLDGLNTPFLDQSYARDHVIKFLQQIEPGDRIALYTLGRDLRMLHDFTTDSASLVEVLRNYKGRLTSDLGTSHPWNDSPLQTFLLGTDSETTAGASLEERLRITARAFQDIANHVAWAPGRKNLIWVSGAFPVTGGLESVGEVLNNANLAVYPVDARGIVGTDLSGEGAGSTFLEGPAGHGDPQSQLTMNTLASITGGRAYYNNNDIKGCIREAINDASVTYELAYAPAGATRNGAYHRIKVEVNAPSAKVRAREGYFAAPLTKPNEHKDAILGATARSPLEATGIELTTRIMSADASTRRIALLTLLDLHQIYFQVVNGKWSGKIDAVVAQVDDRDAIIGVDSQIFSFDMPHDVFQRMLAQGGTYFREVTVDPNAVELRVVIRDDDTGNLGSVNIPLDKYLPRKNRGS
jgi:VWFA-related protein